MIRNKIETDVLIVGGGSAALIAALEAEKHGVDVTIVCKQKAGKSGNTIVSGSAFSVVVPEEDNPDSEEAYYQDIMRSGNGINQEELTRILAQRSGSTIKYLEEYGMNFFIQDNKYVKRQPPGHSYPRSVPTIWDGYSYMARGLSFMKPLFDSVLSRNIRVLEQTMITKLITLENKVCGALAVNANDNEMFEISCKAIVLANGGAGNMFAQNNNTIGITGDSYALAYEAGAVLKDMEFVQFYPTMMIKPVKMPASNPLFGDGAVLRNKDGDLFVHKYVEGGDRAATRDKMAQAIFQEVERGNGVEGGVYFDCRGIPQDILETKYAHFCSQLRKKGIDPLKDMVIVSPTTHYFLGGIKINPKCESSVEGLYACGEAATGVHGANRLSGASIADTVVFGMISGESAANYALDSKRVPIQWETETGNIGLNTSGIMSVVDQKEKVRQLMWESASVVRTEEQIKKGLQELEAIQASLHEVYIGHLKEAQSFIELANMVAVGQLVLQGALLRKESRGSHWRKDYPNPSAEYLGNYEYVKQNDNCSITFHSLKS